MGLLFLSRLKERTGCHESGSIRDSTNNVSSIGDIHISRKSEAELAMRDEPIVGLRCRNTRSSDTTKGVNSSRQQDEAAGVRGAEV